MQPDQWRAILAADTPAEPAHRCRPQPSDSPLTQRQREILCWIAHYLCGHQQMPSIRQIGDHFGMRSPQGVVNVIDALVAKGYLELGNFKQSRSLCLVGARLTLEFDDSPAGQRLREVLEGGEHAQP